MTATDYEAPCLACHGSGMKAVNANWNRTCKHCFGSGLAAPIFDRSRPHAIDHRAYRDGFAKPEAMLALERSDPFWKTLGGSTEDPFGDGGETFKERARAMALGIGANIYDDMMATPSCPANPAEVEYSTSIKSNDR